MRRAIGAGLVLLAAATGLAGCGRSDEPVEAPDTAPSWSDPDAPAGIEVSDGRVTLPAVEGNPGAVYFTVRNDGDEDQAIRSVFVSGADMAMMHETVREGGTTQMRDIAEVAVPAGATVRFAPGGLHVMALGLGGHLEEGGETEVTLTFASGDKASFPAEVRAPGDGGA